MTSDQVLNVGILALLVAAIIVVVTGELVQRWWRR